MIVPYLSICMPSYNGAAVIGETIRCLLAQSFSDFELIVCDDGSTDATCEVARSFEDARVRVIQNEQNVGYARNLERCRLQARGEVIVLMGQDDLVADGMLQRIHEVFQSHPNVGALTRAYFWFHGDLHRPVRVKPPVDPAGDVVLSLRQADPQAVFRAFSSMDQLSGLAMRRAWIEHPVHEHIFPAHVYPMASIWKKHDLMCLHDHTIAVRIESSQARYVSSIYNPSPIWTWVQMFETVFPDPEFDDVRRRCIRDLVARNYVGLVQIRNYGRYSWLLREIGMLLRYRPLNVLAPQFWFLSLGCLVLPPVLLIPMVDWYKRSVLSKAIGPIDFKCVGKS
jgi:glycosyltransferase involved in cell wall biosynthesis